MLIEDMIKRYTMPLFEGEQEGGASAANGGGEGGENTGGDAGAGGDGATDETGTEGARPGAAIDGGTAASEDNTDGTGTSDESGGDTTDGDTEDGDGGDKEGEEKGGQEGDDVTYEPFDIPEGLEVDEQMLDSVTPVMKELGLEQEQAQKMVSAYADIVQQQAEAQADLIKQTFEGWVETAKKDPEIGGDKWQATVDKANAVIRKIGTKELIDDVLVGNGMGNHPEVIRVFARIADDVLSDEAPTGKQTDASGPVSPESDWYGDTTPSAKKG